MVNGEDLAGFQLWRGCTKTYYRARTFNPHHSAFQLPHNSLMVALNWKTYFRFEIASFDDDHNSWCALYYLQVLSKSLLFYNGLWVWFLNFKCPDFGSILTKSMTTIWSLFQGFVCGLW